MLRMEPRRNEDPTLKHSVSWRVRALMGGNRVTQTELAPAIGMSQSSLSRKLKGEVAWDVDDLEVVARYFDIPVTELFGPGSFHYGDSDHVLSSVPMVPGQLNLGDELAAQEHPRELAAVS